MVSSSSKSNNDWSSGKGLLPGREVLGPLMLMASTPCVSIIFFHVCANMQGNFIAFASTCMEKGFFSFLNEIWPNPWNPIVWKWILTFFAFQLFLMKGVPGKTFEGNLTPTGHRPVYTANGTACYLITLLSILVLGYTGVWNPAQIYDHFGEILSSMNIFAWCFCTVLLIKGYVAPSSTDGGTTGILVQDFFWGMELYPRILGWDVKLFTNCRAGMMFWAVGILCFAYKNHELYGLQAGMAVSVALQLVYISKFYHWEMGYMCSMDIQHDRAGYYICWGCLVWVPAVYTSQAFYLTTNAPDLSIGAALAIFVAGWLCIFINYDSDQQRFLFRQTNGHCKIWGEIPDKIVAKYKTSSGQTRESLLLVGGWWKLSRHFHYVPEILASFFWSVSALNSGFVGPYFYTIYLTILLTDRAFRDDDRCRKKYGRHWDKYCEQVPYKIVPGVI